eukprot:Hpha_TRINITY_DN33681_c0_g1::TRINITY_DN33681_c0_g1_i1::g.43337::m.43337
MASAAGYQIAKEKYQAQASQAGLQADIRGQEVFQAELQRSQHTQQALEAQIAKSQAEAETRIAQERLRFYESDFAQSKVSILLQGFHAISAVFHLIAWTAALIMGSVAQMFNKEKVDATGDALTYVFWVVALCALVMLVHCIFVASLSLTDATKLAYQGTKGIDDIRRAFHGLMKRRGEVFWNFMIGFMMFNCEIILTVWVKLDTRDGVGSSSNLSNKSYIFGSVVTALYILIPGIRMIVAFCSIRSEFKVDRTADVTEDFRQQGRTGAELTEQDLVSDRRPQVPNRRPPSTKSANPLPPSQAPPQPGGPLFADRPAPQPDDDDPFEATGGDWGAGRGGGGEAAAPYGVGEEEYAPQGYTPQGRGNGADGFTFGAPPSDEVSPPPPRAGPPVALGRDQWTPDRHAPECSACRVPFTRLRRKHHCRLCGEVFCHACSRNQLRMLKANRKGTSLERVCDDCLQGGRFDDNQLGPQLREDLSSMAGSIRSRNT